MPLRKISIAILLIASPVVAADVELQTGKAVDGAVASGQSYALQARSGDFVEIKLQSKGGDLVASVLDSSAAKIRAFRVSGEQKLDFVTNVSGRYRVEVAGDKSKDATYTITLLRIVPLADRVAPPRVTAKYESPRLKKLRTAVEAGDRSGVAKFWEDVKAKGAPVVEPLEGDDRNMLVTFLWKGDSDTRNVLVLWQPFTAEWPDDFQMSRLAGTDIWYRTYRIDKRKRFAYRLAPNVPQLRASHQNPTSDETASMVFGSSQRDPLNPMQWFANAEDPDLPIYKGFSAFEMPGAPPQPWIKKREGVPAGTVEKLRVSSALLKNEREVAVYTPPGYSKDAKPYGLVVLFDERAYLDQVPTPVILDNLIADHRIPPMVAVLLDNAPGARSRELPCNSVFADFLNFELAPWIHRLYNVTSDPRQTVVGGSSYGGLAAAWAGLRHPETFGNILSQSGSYWWTPEPRSPDTEPTWVAKQFIESPRLPIRFYMDAGSDELDLSGQGGSILIPNRHMRDVLLAKGYEVHYQEYAGGHDYLSWRGTLADGLILLTGAPPAP